MKLPKELQLAKLVAEAPEGDDWLHEVKFDGYRIIAIKDGADVKLLGGVLGDGYIGFSHLSATNALYLADAIEVLHSFGGWQLHDNYFGGLGGSEPVTGRVLQGSG